MEALGDDRCGVVVGSWSWQALTAWTGFFDVDIEVVGPAELRDAAAHLAQRYTDALGSPPSPAPPT